MTVLDWWEVLHGMAGIVTAGLLVAGIYYNH